LPPFRVDIKWSPRLKAFKKALHTYDADTKIGFPNTAYYLPVIYSLTGLKV
jgi:hypothetical protein